MTIDRAIEILNPTHREHYDGKRDTSVAPGPCCAAEDRTLAETSGGSRRGGGINAQATQNLP